MESASPTTVTQAMMAKDLVANLGEPEEFANYYFKQGVLWRALLFGDQNYEEKDLPKYPKELQELIRAGHKIKRMAILFLSKDHSKTRDGKIKPQCRFANPKEMLQPIDFTDTWTVPLGVSVCDIKIEVKGKTMRADEADPKYYKGSYMSYGGIPVFVTWSQQTGTNGKTLDALHHIVLGEGMTPEQKSVVDTAMNHLFKLELQSPESCEEKFEFARCRFFGIKI